jgi:hypothetical protein
MKYLKKYKVFESVDGIKSMIENILRDNILDKEIPLEIIINNFSTRLGEPISSVLKIEIGNDLADFDEFIINVDDIKEDIKTITSYLDGEGYEYKTFGYQKSDFSSDYPDYDPDFGLVSDAGDVIKSNVLETNYLSLLYKKEVRDPYLEKIEVPIEVGDTILGGKFKNKKVVVKKIGKNKKGDITVNDKPLLKFRLVKESLEEDVNYYFKHLEDDGFVVESDNDYIRIFKPIKIQDNSSYSYSNSNPFQWSEISSEIGRYVDELDDSENSEKSIDYCYVVILNGSFADRELIHTNSLIDDNFDAGRIISFVIGFR